jgi:phosphomannomutase
MQSSISGARGIVGVDLTPETMLPILYAFDRYLPKGLIVIGTDTRPSGPSIRYFIGGILCLLGRDVLTVEICTTPSTAIATKAFGAAGGIIVTASHNPAQWNALKLLDGNGLFLPPEFWNIVNSGERIEPNWATFDHIGTGTRRADVCKTHVQLVLGLPFVDVALVRNMRYRIAYDGVEGAGPAIMIPLLRELGCDLVLTGHRMTGEFQHEPEPVPKNLGELSSLVKAHGSDIGLVTDPDADRLAIVDEHGVAIGEEFTFALAVQSILSMQPGDIVVNLSTSTMAEFIADKFCVDVYRTPVGEYWVSKKMLEIGAIAGGEGNGGLILPHVHPIRDAATAAALILTLMAKTEKKVSELVAELPQKYTLKEKLPLPHDFDALCEKVGTRFHPQSIDKSDGYWFKTATGFVHIRKSNTEPIMRVIIEADTEKTAGDYLKIITEII